MRLALSPVIIFALMATKAYSFDPFTIAAVGGAVANGVSAASEVAGEVASSADAFNELYSEIDSDAQISEDGQKIIDEVREIQSLAEEAGYTLEEIDSLGHQDPNELKKLSTTLRAVTRAVRAGKRAFKLVMKLDQKAKLAEVESAQLQKEQLAATYRIIRLQNEANLQATKRDLRDLVEKKKQIEGLKTELKEKGAKTFGRSGVLSFPKTERVVENSIAVANRLRSALISLVLVVFLMRVVFYQMGFFGVARYGDLLKDTILCFLLLMVYPDLVRAILHYTEFLAAKIGDTRLESIQPKELALPGLKEASTSTKLFLAWLFEWIRYTAFSIIDFIMTFGISFMVMLFPIIVFSSQMLNFAIAWPIFIGSFITICLWPIFWNLVGLAAQLSWDQNQKTFAESLYSVFLSLIQLFSPIVGIKLMSGQSLSKAIKDGATSFSQPFAKAIQSMVGANQERRSAKDGMLSEKPSASLFGKNGLPSVGRMVGSVQGYAMNQIKSRKSNAATADKEPLRYGELHKGMSNKNRALILNSTEKPNSRSSHLATFMRGLKAQPIQNDRGKKKQ
ncbi:MAG: hypothetical protein KGQ59_01230 [Bdellovibrionales bacterium]|nr:hypothetical protein [Bdellovibrionales bacterium]